MADLEITKARTAKSVTIRTIKGNINIDSLSDAAALEALSRSAVKVGAIVEFSESTPRTTTPRYELDADLAGDIVERIPGLVDRTLTIQRAVLYTSDMLQAMGYDSAVDIIEQNVPFVIVKVERSPAGSGVATKTTVYTGCWFHDLPKSYSYQGDVRVVQNVEVGYTRKFTI